MYFIAVPCIPAFSIQGYACGYIPACTLAISYLQMPDTDQPFPGLSIPAVSPARYPITSG